MAAQHETIAPAWSVRLPTDLLANDETAKRLFAGLNDEQLSWQLAPGSWSMGQGLEHLCIMNEVYLPPISAALKDKPDSPVEQITAGWWRLVYPQLCRAHVGQRARSRSGENQTRIACRSLRPQSLPGWQPIVPRHHRARWKQERKPHSLLESFHPRTSVHSRDWAGDHGETRTPSSIVSRASPRRGELPALVESAMPFSVEQT